MIDKMLAKMVYKILLCVVLSVFGVQSQLFSGDVCTPSLGNGGNRGICIPLKECRAAVTAVQSGLRPDLCGFQGNTPLVCCPTGAPLQESISQQKCRQYSTFQPEFQVFAIVGGVQTLPREFPHMAALGYSNGNRIMWLCGGSLVSEQYILTAAHCLAHATFGPVSRVRLGDLNLYSSFDIASPQDFTISSRIPHPSYQSPAVYNDIALIRLARPAQFTNFVRPACLYPSSNIPPTTELIATGWGLTEQGGNPSQTLQKVDLDLFSEKKCNESYENMAGSRRLKEGIISEIQICAGGKNNDKDTCQGDSGGPLQTYIRSERIYSIVGVTSFGKSCGASIPGVYTRVSYYVPWLETVIWPNN